MTYQGRERRHDHARRLAVSEMSRDELVLALLTDVMTGLGNRRAFEEAEARGPAMGYAALDVVGLKWLNDTHGHAVGDAAIRAAGTALIFLRETARLADVEAEAYRTGGDEFMVRFTRVRETAQATALLRGATGVLLRARAPIHLGPGGRQRGIIHGLRIRWGYGPTAQAADAALVYSRAQDTVERGQHPPGLTVLQVDVGRPGDESRTAQVSGPAEPA